MERLEEALAWISAIGAFVWSAMVLASVVIWIL